MHFKKVDELVTESNLKNLDLSFEDRDEVLADKKNFQKAIAKIFWTFKKSGNMPLYDVDVRVDDPEMDGDSGEKSFDIDGSIVIKYKGKMIPLAVFGNGTVHIETRTDSGDYYTPSYTDVVSSDVEWEDFSIMLDGGFDDEILTLSDISKNKKLMKDLNDWVDG